MAGRETRIPKGLVPHRRSGIHRGFSYIAHNRRNVRFKGMRRVHTPPQPLTAHTAAYTPKHGAFSLPETSAGSIGSTAWVPCASSLSARHSSISRFPLLRRTTAEMPISLRGKACRLCGDRSNHAAVRRIQRCQEPYVQTRLALFAARHLAGGFISGASRSGAKALFSEKTR